ncbi:helicase [Actinobaculum suis]|uniref:Helicase n=1 Tax=Actinobaculum suis TaxID=1657 RepID=A0A1B9BDK0_9ACTO|nr:DEAD/DEAH box helicase [Actinobaculum suis]OCA94673.1 DEAD/DEAH box helicase [Actinobaculum suis]OCA95376.1 DEAD/DEAH box helicase [Actinobaculum suis]VDG76924.1 helicase [Actinobaculum suis]
MALPQLNVALDRLEDEYGLNPPDDALYDAFTQWAEGTGRPLYPHQEEALLGCLEGSHLIVSTPTGSGKSMVALIAIFNALAHGQTAFYTAPLKALVSEKFFELIDAFGADNVGMMTGDSTINREAPIICATAEIVANIALREGKDADIDVLVQDEFHYYGDPQRGWAWQVPLLELPQTRQILLSATLGDTSRIEEDLEKRTGRRVALITGAERPVPLDFHYSYTPTNELVQDLIAKGQAPVYIVHFSQRQAIETATGFQSISLVTPAQKEKIREAIGDFKFSAGFGKILSRLLRQGIGVHHAGLLPRYRRLVERLAQAGLLPVISGTDTLGVGINVPIRTVLMTGLVKYDGRRERRLSAREFHQIAGRAGRAGFDTQGDVIAQAPEFEIENARALANAGDDPQKIKRIQKKRPPEGAVLWSENTFDYLQSASPEQLQSQMRVNHSFILNMLQRSGDAVAQICYTLSHTHEPQQASNPLLRQALSVYQTLHRAGVLVHRSPQWQAEHPGESAVSFAREVPEDFALNSPLAPFALAALDLLDPDSADYPLDVISVIEAVQESPRQILYAQEKVARGQAINRMKLAGVPYEERMAEADKITWPQPLAEELRAALDIYAQTNPWVADYELVPKSIVREMIENAQTFSEFVSRYDAERSEGVLLRYLTDTYKALRQSVPLEARTEELESMINWLGQLVRSVDSSLLDEWEALRDGTLTSAELTRIESDPEGGARELAYGADADGTVRLSRSKHAFRKSIRNALFHIVEAVAREDLDALDETGRAPLWEGGVFWGGDEWMDATDPFFDEYEEILIGADARSSRFVNINEAPDAAALVAAGVPESETARFDNGDWWLARQTFDDGADDNAWGFWALIDLAESDKENTAMLRVISVGEL